MNRSFTKMLYKNKEADEMTERGRRRKMFAV